MAHKLVEQEYEENLEYDLLNDALDALAEGARGSGATLTEGECAILLKKIPPVWSKGFSWWELIAHYSFHQETGPGTVDAAVVATMQKFNVCRQTVYDARRRWDEYLEYLNHLRSRDESN